MKALAKRAKILALQRLAVRRNVEYQSDLHVGLGTVVWAPRGLVIGADVYIGKNATIQVDGKIGRGVLIANNVGIIGRTDHDLRDVGVLISRARWVGEYPSDLSMSVDIGDDCWIGFGAIVLSGVTIGRSSVVAAGSIVSHDVPSNVIVAGAPARVIRQRFDPITLQQHWAGIDGE